MECLDRSKLVVVTLLAVFGAGCTNEPEADQGASVAAVDSAAPVAGQATLKLIMTGLATDMADLAMGLWLEDSTAIAEAAARIADHPRVPPEQMVAIQTELGADFGEFVAFDQLVHDRAVALREAARSGQVIDELAGGFTQLADGCVACHTTFRARISATLAAPAPGN